MALTMVQTSAALATTSGWVSGAAGRRWRSTWRSVGSPPATGEQAPASAQVRGTVLFLPPLGDEMNHTRSLMAAAARALSAAGWTVQCTDPFGTGDSEGDFVDASLAIWAEDFAADAAAAARQGPWVLWVARQGALLLPALWRALQRGGVPMPVALASWNPVVQGSAVVTQWLRLAALGNTGNTGTTGTSGTTGSTGSRPGQGIEFLRRQLAAGMPVECAGYRLSPAFANELESELEVVPESPFPVATREWDAVASGARRFWLPTETDIDTTLVIPLVEWLNALVPQTDAVLVQGEGEGDTAAGVPCLLEVPAGANARCGVLFVVGGPQYRVGAHRQFVRWSRRFNAAGHATCRFDRAGTGDARGQRAALLDCGVELRATLEAAIVATGISRWVVFGLCDGATLALLHLVNHPAVAGLVALNPWAPVAVSAQSQALVREYYGRQWQSRAFWGRLLRGEVKVVGALREWWQHRQAACDTAGRPAVLAADAHAPAHAVANLGLDLAEVALAEALLTNAMACPVPVLWALSGNDRTAAEFRAMVAASEQWQGVLARPGATRLELPAADHTLSEAADHEQFGTAVLVWLTRVA